MPSDDSSSHPMPAGSWARGRAVSAVFFVILLLAGVHCALAIQAPTGLISITGDLSVVLHWDLDPDPTLGSYNIYCSTSGSNGVFSKIASAVVPLGYCDISASRVVNGRTNYYYITAESTTSQESSPSAAVAAVPNPFLTTNALLNYVQETCFDYFWYWANPANGLVPDRSETSSAASIAAVGFGLTAIGIAIDHSWITRTAGVARVLTTLNTFANGPQGTNTAGVIGYNGWFYHYLDMNTALRSGGSELSSIDTCLLLGGVLYCRQYFNQTNSNEAQIRSLADQIFNAVNWTWMARGTDAVSMAWYPGGTGFSANNWIGYNEGMIIYILGLGAPTNYLPASAWNEWTSGYSWQTVSGQSFVYYPPMFVYEYSHCWIDFRHVADAYMNNRSSSYFENSRRMALAQVAYCSQTPAPYPGYNTNDWGLTASDDPGNGNPTYVVHGLPGGVPPGTDNGTIAPTAAGGAMPFAPEYAVPAILHFYNQFRQHIWTAFSFRDAFNLGQGWYDTDELGIDQGPIIIMIENYLTQKPWNLFMQNPVVQSGLQRAGFMALPFVPLSVQAFPQQNTVTLSWNAQTNTFYQVEYSPDLSTWFIAPTGYLQASGPTATWSDTGPPGTVSPPFGVTARFYRVFQYGAPGSTIERLAGN